MTDLDHGLSQGALSPEGRRRRDEMLGQLQRFMIRRRRRRAAARAAGVAAFPLAVTAIVAWMAWPVPTTVPPAGGPSVVAEAPVGEPPATDPVDAPASPPAPRMQHASFALITTPSPSRQPLDLSDEDLLSVMAEAGMHAGIVRTADRVIITVNDEPPATAPHGSDAPDGSGRSALPAAGTGVS